MNLVPLFTAILTDLQLVGAVVGALWLSWNGFTYMSSAGNAMKQEHAKSGAIAVLLGLILVEAAAGIANFLVTNIPKA